MVIAKLVWVNFVHLGMFGSPAVSLAKATLSQLEKGGEDLSPGCGKQRTDAASKKQMLKS